MKRYKFRKLFATVQIQVLVLAKTYIS